MIFVTFQILTEWFIDFSKSDTTPILKNREQMASQTLKKKST